MRRNELIETSPGLWEAISDPLCAPVVRLVATGATLAGIQDSQLLARLRAAAGLRGVVHPAVGLPGLHWGAGMPQATVLATDPDLGGVVVPGAIGHDIGNGVRLIATQLEAGEIRSRVPSLLRALKTEIPLHREDSQRPWLSHGMMDQVLTNGAQWAAQQGYGASDDLTTLDEKGRMPGAGVHALSAQAKARGQTQFATLGSGEARITLYAVSHILDTAKTKQYGIDEGRVHVLVQSGSRGIGFQVCEDAVESMMRPMAFYRIRVPVRELSCAPVHSREGREYLAATAAAVNFALANRQALAHEVVQSLSRFLHMPSVHLGACTVTDQIHRTARFEVFPVEGIRKRLCMHRKGAFGTDPTGARPIFVAGLLTDALEASAFLCAPGPQADCTYLSASHAASRRLYGCHQPGGQSGHGTGAAERMEYGTGEEYVVKLLEQAGILTPIARLSALGSIGT